MCNLKILLLTIGLAAVVSVTEPISAAQSNQENSSGIQSSFKNKLTALQDKVKEQVQSLRGRKTNSSTRDAMASSPTDHFHFDRRRMEPQHQNPIAQATYEDHGRGSRQQSQRSVGQSSQQVQYEQSLQGNGRRRNRQIPVEPVVPFVDVNELNQQQINAQANSRSTTSYTMPNPVHQNSLNQQSYSNDPALIPDASQAAQFSNPQFSNQPMSNQLRSTDGVQPYDNNMAVAQLGGDARASGHYRNGYSRVETLADQRQMTASQRVLQLQIDNRSLTEQRDAALAENKRLSDIIIENQKLLSRADASIESAMKQLESSNHSNQILKQRIAQLTSEKESVVAESKRMLDSIRKRLDDVLIREISSK